MPTETLISVEEYLATSYRPDCDYVDGRIEERNAGEWDHGRLQLKIGAYFLARQREWNTYASTEQRVQVREGRFRVPDVCVTLGDPQERILTRAPFICIEVLSPEDRMIRVEKRIDDYLGMGVALRVGGRSADAQGLLSDCGDRFVRSEERRAQDRKSRA
jgi:Uma2 family endonuclease